MATLVDNTVVQRRGNPDGGPTRSDTHRVTASLNGENMGVFDKKTGGGLDSNMLTYKPGGMGPQISLGGSTQTDNVVLSRLYRLQRDHARAQKWLNQVGKGQVVVTDQPLDVDGNPFGKPIVYKGTLKRVLLPEVDSESSNAAMLEIEVSIDGSPHVGS